jgi:ribonuclease P protein component
MDRLKQRADFLAAANGPRMSAPAFTVQSLARDDNGPVRVGFTVSKKVGNAPERNRVRRRLRELVKRLDVTSMRPHHDYVIIGRRTALDRGFETMFNDLRSALARLERQPAKPSLSPRAKAE